MNLSEKIRFMRLLSLFYSDDVSKKDLKFIDIFANLPIGANYSKHLTVKGIELLNILCKKYKRYNNE